MQFIEKWKTPRNLELENDGKIQENLNWKMMDNANDTIGHLFAPFQNIDGRYVSRNLLARNVNFLCEENA